MISKKTVLNHKSYKQTVNIIISSVFFMMVILFLGIVLLYELDILSFGVLKTTQGMKKFLTSESETSIPQVIHFVWLGSEELPDAVQKAIKTWKIHQPDFQIKRWDEKNCNIRSNFFAQKAYEEKKFDFASDYCRLEALLEGGVYFDTDMLLKTPIAPLLDEPLVLTMQKENDLSASFMAVIPNHPFVQALKKDYENRKLSRDNHTQIVWLEEQNAPSTWSRVFRQFFQTEEIKIERNFEQYHVYAPNVMMYDFHGKENVAEHLFGAGANDATTSSWYDTFRKLYLKQFALYFPLENKYFIFTDNTTGYFYDIRKDEAEKSQSCIFSSIFKLFYQTNSQLFFCLNKTCYFLTNKHPKNPS